MISPKAGCIVKALLAAKNFSANLRQAAISIERHLSVQPASIKSKRISIIVVVMLVSLFSGQPSVFYGHLVR
jgi:hypothetical protein